MDSKNIQIRKLVDDIFALQWCRENIVVPLGFEQNNNTSNARLIIAIGNISYPLLISSKEEPRPSMECVFVEKPPEEIQQLLDNANSA